MNQHPPKTGLKHANASRSCSGNSRFSPFQIGLVSRALFISMGLALSLSACAGDVEVVEETIIPVMEISPGTTGDTIGGGEEAPEVENQMSDVVADAEEVSEQVADVEQGDGTGDVWVPPVEDVGDESDAGESDAEVSLPDVQEPVEGDTVELDAGSVEEDGDDPEEIDIEEEEATEDSSGGSEVNIDLKTCKDGCGADDLECTGVCGGSPLCLAQCAAANTECLDGCEAAFGD